MVEITKAFIEKVAAAIHTQTVTFDEFGVNTDNEVKKVVHNICYSIIVDMADGRDTKEITKQLIDYFVAVNPHSTEERYSAWIEFELPEILFE